MRLVGKTPVIKGTEIKSMFDSPKKISSSSFVLLYKKSDRRGVAFTVKRNASKNAVMRNRIKRVLREAFIFAEDSFPLNFNYLFIGLKSAYDNESDNLKTEMDKAGGLLSGK